MQPTLSISIHDEHNLGDRVCNPCGYFDALKDVRRMNAWDVNWIYQPEHLVLGGGGMVHGLLAQLIEYVPRVKGRRLIAWGMGHNQHGESFIDYHKVLDGFDLVGVRDYRTAAVKGWEYVPCVSCMNGAFEEVAGEKAVHPVVVYQHYDNPIKLRFTKGAMPTMTNEVPGLKDALAFLASGEVVVTNSYHGAYWAMLLGRKVMIYRPFASRFCDLKWQPPSCHEGNWMRVAAKGAPEGYLQECRAANVAFYAKVREMVGVEEVVVATTTAPPPNTGLACQAESGVG